jgi:hypothetical protein
MGDTSLPKPLAQPVNHFHSQTTIEGLAPTFGMPQQTMASMFRQGYMQTTPSFSMPNFTLAPYNPGGNGRAYAHASRNYQAPYTTVAYTDPIPLPISSLGFLPNHAYQKMHCDLMPTASQKLVALLKIPHRNFPLGHNRLHMTPARFTIEPIMDPNNLTNQLATILCESFGIELKG